MMGLLTQASVAIDGSKFKAVNNRDKNFTRAKMDRRMFALDRRYSCHKTYPGRARSTFCALQDALFNHFVGTAKEANRERDPECPGCLHVDEQFNLCRLLQANQTLPQAAGNCYGYHLVPRTGCRSLGECKMSRKSILPLSVALMFVAGNTAMAEPRPRPCAVDIKAFCTDIQPGEGRIAACIKEHISDFSPGCKARLIAAIVATRECAADVKGQCTGTNHTSKEVIACLREVLPNLSNLCKTAILAATLRSR